MNAELAEIIYYQMLEMEQRLEKKAEAIIKVTQKLEELVQKIEAMGMTKEDYDWYLDSRKYGSVPHAGFGLGFERMMMLVTGITNIRDVIPFPRTPKSISF